MIGSIRVESFRSFVDSGEIEIKPLTILVGRNSSGKSSLLRVLPLLKQSVSEETKEPILWFGGVDFGSLSQVRSRFSSATPVSFELSFDGISRSSDEVLISEFGEKYYVRSPGGAAGSIFLDDSETVRISQQLDDVASGEGARVSRLICNVGGDSLALFFGPNGNVAQINFNGLVLDNVGSVSVVVVKKGFFPRFVDNSRAGTPTQLNRAMRDGPFFAALLRSLDKLFHHKVLEDGRRAITRSLRFGSQDSFRSHLEQTFTSTSTRVLSICDTNPDEFEKIRALVLLRMLPELVRRASHQLEKFCSGVRYIEPVRARASRYYRYQELAVDDIASDGANVPVFLHSLNRKDREDLETWLSKSLGFAVSAERSGDGHIQLLVQENGTGSLVNLADTGFGYSQILPIALQLWKVNRSRIGVKRRHADEDASVIAIEQPELHLHPQMQAVLSDVFALSLSTAKAAGSSLRLLIETHSEHLISRVGELIEQGRLAADEVVVYVFDRESMDDPTRVKRAFFSDKGYLLDPWPLGFFVPRLSHFEEPAPEVGGLPERVHVD